MKKFNAALRNGLEELQISIPEDTITSMETYAAFLRESNTVMNLTAITEPAEMARMHFLDSIALSGAVELHGKKLIDIGTGAGFPGLPLKLADPTISLTLLDSQQKRIFFLEEVIRRLHLSDVELKNERAEELSRCIGFRDSFDVAISRAVADLQLLCELCLPFVTVGGYFLAMKANDCAEEMERAKQAVEILGGAYSPAYSYIVPGTEIKRQIIVVQKVAATPDQYPRRFAKMQKSPL